MTYSDPELSVTHEHQAAIEYRFGFLWDPAEVNCIAADAEKSETLNFNIFVIKQVKLLLEIFPPQMHSLDLYAF